MRSVFLYLFVILLSFSYGCDESEKKIESNNIRNTRNRIDEHLDSLIESKDELTQEMILNTIRDLEKENLDPTLDRIVDRLSERLINVARILFRLAREEIITWKTAPLTIEGGDVVKIIKRD